MRVLHGRQPQQLPAATGRHRGLVSGTTRYEHPQWSIPLPLFHSSIPPFLYGIPPYEVGHQNKTVGRGRGTRHGTLVSLPSQQSCRVASGGWKPPCAGGANGKMAVSFRCSWPRKSQFNPGLSMMSLPPSQEQPWRTHRRVCRIAIPYHTIPNQTILYHTKPALLIGERGHQCPRRIAL